MKNLQILAFFILLSTFCNAQKIEIPKLPEWISSQYVTEHYNGYTLKYFPKKLVTFLHKKRPTIQNNIISFGRVIGISDITQYNGNAREGVQITYSNGLPSTLCLFVNGDIILYAMKIFPGTKSPEWIKNGFWGSDGLSWWANGEMKYFENNRLVWDNNPKTLLSQNLFNSTGIFKDYEWSFKDIPNKYDVKTKNGKLVYVKAHWIADVTSEHYSEFTIDDEYIKGKNPQTGNFDIFFPSKSWNYTIVNRKPINANEYQFKYDEDILIFIKKFFKLVNSSDIKK